MNDSITTNTLADHTPRPLACALHQLTVMRTACYGDPDEYIEGAVDNIRLADNELSALRELLLATQRAAIEVAEERDRLRAALYSAREALEYSPNPEFKERVIRDVRADLAKAGGRNP